ncbi:MAG: metallophosphoesterase [Planctomycetota bacterium]|nr:MAG: metallophosphoesterase [Planctomycetota bacterium]
MPHLQPCLVLAAAWIGNCGFWLFCVNRVNATGLSRHLIKRLEKLFISLCFLLPALILWTDGPQLWQWLPTDRWWPSSTRLFDLYAPWYLASFAVLGAAWLESRWWLIPPPHLRRTGKRRVHVHRQISGGSFASVDARWLARIPGNQIGWVEVTNKQLRIPRHVPDAEGLKIGHLSDLHFTGQLSPAHYQRVFAELQTAAPDLIVLTGDIIDYPQCLPWIEPLLGELHAPLGCAFVLGNHDRRLPDIAPLLAAMRNLGWIDLGRDTFGTRLHRGQLAIELVGTEAPWFQRGAVENQAYESRPPGPAELRIAVSHSPDQWRWARRHHCDLMLAGHTHGGQIRLPGIGPLVAPSWYGSKYASGVFFRPPTLMHVSRGVAGIHPLRFRCYPEVSILTLTNLVVTKNVAPETRPRKQMAGAHA